jgi:hypothetical protein
MDKISKIKSQILEARKNKNLDLEIDLLEKLKPVKIETVNQAYAQLADSP